MTLHIVPAKRCFTCKEAKLASEFIKKKDGKGGLYFECKKCKNARAHKKYWEDPNRYRKRNRRYYQSPAGVIKRREYALQKHGITIDQYDQMFEEQNGVCAICGLPELMKRLAIDHNHKTNEIRGLLCQKCNRAIGLLRDDPQLFEKAKMYIENVTYIEA